MNRTVPVGRLSNLVNSQRGLSHDEFKARLNQYGHNNIVETASTGWLTLVKDTATDPMLWFLLVTAVIFFFLEDWVEAVTLLLAIIPLIGMDVYLHRRTSASTEGLTSRLAVQAKAQRSGRVMIITATDIVPGDLLIIGAGENIPADGVIIKSESMQVDESALTGEAYPVRKQPLKILDTSLKNSPIDTVHWVNAGTRLLTGTAMVRVIYTASETIYGQIVRSATTGSHERTPLQSAISNLVGVLLIVALIMCVVLAWVRIRQGFGILDAFLSAVTLAVAALPEEFPVVFTFFLGVGVYRLAQRRALVRRSVVVENIGRVSSICSDKTGTITEGKLQLTHQFPSDGYTEKSLLVCATMASRKETGDPLDLAIFNESTMVPIENSLVSTFPFTEDRKRETAVWRNVDGSMISTTKGAPETVLAMCACSEAEKKQWDAKVLELAESGHKIIACAELNLTTASWTGGEPDRMFRFLGLLAFEDPVRSGVSEAIKNCKDGGIHIIMVTGDHPATARAVAREIGLGQPEPNVIEAEKLQFILHRNAAELKTIDVIARAIPSQKLDLVRGLQSIGEIVAVTGDGVNDVPALQAADIGFAMGERGTRSAREIASIVLLDDNFRTITRAIAEGRQLFRNLKLSFAYLLMIHIPLILTAAIIPLVGYPLLYLPIHIVWLELIIHPTALLVFQELPASENLETMKKNRQLKFFRLREWFVIACVGILITLMIILGYDRSLGIGREVEHARAMTMVILTFASATLVIILSGLSTRTSQVIVVVTIMLSLLLVQVPVLSSFLHLTPLHIDDLALGIVSALCIATVSVFGHLRGKA